MNRKINFLNSLIITLCLIPLFSFQKVSIIKFEKQMIAAESAESVGVFDVNGEGVVDLISGSYWYAAPSYMEHHFNRSGRKIL